MRIVHLSLALTLIGAGLLACGHDSTGPTGSKYQLTIVAGDSQIASAGQPMAVNPSVRVEDASGRPLVGVTVTFSVESGGGAIDPVHDQLTDSSGIATIPSWQLGNSGGSNTLRASFKGESVSLLAYGVTWGLATGNRFSCGISPSGTFCWGQNDRGQLGNNSNSNRLTPVAVGGAHAFVALTAGDEFACGLTLDETAWCWGANEQGQLGDNSFADQSLPVRVAGGRRFTTLNSSGTHTCGLTHSGAAYCWGTNYYGELGTGDTSRVSRGLPVAVAGGVTFVSVATGSAHTCALTAMHDAWCWGLNLFGQVGDESPGLERVVPVPVAGGEKFAELFLGGHHSCGIREGDGAALCWGANRRGQLGVADTLDRAIPTAVSGGHVFTRLALGNSHTCGRDLVSFTFCWGDNSLHQLGDNTIAPELAPSMVFGPFAAGQIAAGVYHTCATTSGTARCWGSNDGGQLGDNSTSPRGVPTLVAGGLQFLGRP